ncbi:MAG: phosphodiester glycosidase family protein [Oscillospiraceae bacterium]
MQKKQFTRTFSLILAACLLFSSGALASVIGEVINGYETFLGAGMELSKGVYWTGSDYRTENYIEYTPSKDVSPVVVSGSKVCNYGNFSTMAALLEKEGKHVIAGINGDYFVTANYEPLGIVVQEGKLLSSDAGHYGVGFFADGNAIFGKPKLSISTQIGGNAFAMDSLNKKRGAGGASVFTDSYAPTTKNSTPGTDILCSVNGEFTINCALTLTVDEVQKASGATAIPAGKVLISVGDGASEALLSAVAALKPGDQIPLNISAPEEWKNVSYALGSLYKLITNGKLETGLENGVAPRSAIGKKADGSLVFYTMDGRKPGHSVGVTMTQLAQRMLELGCTEAAIMDGGGSTSMNAIYVGDSSVSQINKPSDGYQRSVTNYIMLVTENKPTGKADRLALYPLTTHLLSGASSNFIVKAADKNGYALAPDRYVTMEVDKGLGTIEPNGVFTATGAGTGTLTASAEGLVSAAVQINIVKTPDKISIKSENSGNTLSSLNAATNISVPLSAYCESNHVSLISKDSCYTWSVSGNIGSIDANGTFTSGKETAKGTISATAGEKTVTIPVSVINPEKYDDVKPGDWFYDAVKYVSDGGFMAGTAERSFSPNDATSRAMAVTVLHRMKGAPAPVGGTGSFGDVPANQWFTNAVYWANENGIVQGFGGNFDPNASITREQLAAILYRYSGSPATGGSLAAFADADKASDWAKTPLAWAVEKGLISGISPTELSPQTTASRAQFASILMRMK